MKKIKEFFSSWLFIVDVRRVISFIVVFCGLALLGGVYIGLNIKTKKLHHTQGNIVEHLGKITGKLLDHSGRIAHLESEPEIRVEKGVLLVTDKMKTILDDVDIVCNDTKTKTKGR